MSRRLVGSASNNQIFSPNLSIGARGLDGRGSKMVMIPSIKGIISRKNEEQEQD